jgi:hypothetical protein
MISLFHSWAYIQTNIRQHTVETLAHQLFIVAPFIIAKLWNQPMCPITDERIKKMW